MLLALLLIGCNEKSPPPSEDAEDIVVLPQDTLEDTITCGEVTDYQILSIDSNEVVFSPTNPNLVVANWENEDFILSCESDYFLEELTYYIGYERETWQNITSPFKATYTGNQFGDYFHILFEDDTNHLYDFGFGNNEFGEHQLFEDNGHYEDNPLYLNKEFLVYWEWKVSFFPCCSGEYYGAEAYLPSIVKLELIDE